MEIIRKLQNFNKVLAAVVDPGGGGGGTTPEGGNNSVIGDIDLPDFFKYGEMEGGLGNFLNNILMLITTVAGLFALFNLIMAGYGYMSANGDEKKIQQAWAKIWQSLLGLGIVAAAFLIAALVGWIFFKDPTFIINPKIYGPGQWTRQDTKI